jgi:nucleotide-binding universal stress UspA family protein
MKRKVLLPTDFSDNSWSAIVYALRLHKNVPCTFYILHSYELKVSTMSNLSNKLLEIMKENAIKKLQELRLQIKEANVNKDFDFQLIISSKNVVKAIEDTVEEHLIDLVIMGTKGVTGAQKFFFGSNTVRVIKHMKLCPVLITPEEFDFVKPTQIAFPTDYNRFYSTIELRPLKDLVKLYNTKIRILHINIEKELDDIQEYNYLMLKEYLKNFDHSFHWIPSYTKKKKEINEFIKDLDINILAMVNYKHSFIENIIKEPVVKEIGFHPIIPFLVIPS